MDKKATYRYLAYGVAVGLACFTGVAVANQDLQGIARGVTEQVNAVASLLVVVSYVAGVGFALNGIIKFRAHQISPQQTPLSQPITMIAIAACLLFLPTIMRAAGTTIFGSDKSVGSGDFTATDLE
ncbi:MAG: DUF6750 family protein [Bacteroidota bacterium]